MSGAGPAGAGDAGAAGAVEGAEAAGDVPWEPGDEILGVAPADPCPCPTAERTPGMSRYAPMPPSTTTMPTKASTRWAGLRSMTLRYFFRRTGRSQKGPGGPASVPGLAWPPPAWPPPPGPPPNWLGAAGGGAERPAPP